MKQYLLITILSFFFTFGFSIDPGKANNIILSKLGLNNVQIQKDLVSSIAQKEIINLKKSEVENAQRIKRQTFLRNLLIVLIILTLTTTILSFTRYRHAKKINKLLEEQKKEITQNNIKLTKLNEYQILQKHKEEKLVQELKQSNQKLLESEKNLLELNATKDKFFSIISHDLRNPFAAIISFSRIFKRDIEGLTPEEIKELTIELDKSINKINDLLENLLWWSRMQTGRLAFRPDCVHLSSLFDEVIQQYMPNITDKNLTLSCSIPKKIHVSGDSSLIEVIIRNLLSNAVKYSNNGQQIKVTATLTEGFAHITFKDHGVGISQENLSKLFHIESGLATFGTADEKGSGLGLILCKAFTEKHGGTLSLTSEVNKGTMVSFTLPIDNPESV